MVKTGYRGFVALNVVLIVAVFLLLLPRTIQAFSVPSWKTQKAAASSRDSKNDAGLYASLSSSTSDDDDAAPSWSMVESLTVHTLDDQTVVLNDVVKNKNDRGFILTCLSHFGDFNAWEMTQQYVAALEAGRIPNER
jgi:hypothetical protein